MFTQMFIYQLPNMAETIRLSSTLEWFECALDELCLLEENFQPAFDALDRLAPVQDLFLDSREEHDG